MTPEEYKQLKAFARQDGALLSLLWIGALVCYIMGLTNPLLGMAALLLVVVSPFYAANRLRHYRDDVLEGIISFFRAYGHTVLTYFYAGLLLAAAIWAYFSFMDKGYLMGKIVEAFQSEPGQQLMKLYGMADQMKQGLEQMSQMRPIDHALNVLTISISAGFILGLPVAALMQRKRLQRVG